MLYHFFYPLAKYYTFLNVFGYITVRSVIAFIMTFLLALIIFPFFIKIMKKWKANQIIRDDGPESHYDKVGTPTMGGVVVIFTIVLTLLVCGNFSNLFIITILFCTISFGVVGMLDDYLKVSKKSSDGLHAKFKLISQILLALIISITIYLALGKDLSYISIPFFKNLQIPLDGVSLFYIKIPDYFFYIPIATFIIVGASNAVNLTDGLDGLAAGLLVAVFATFGLLSYITGHKEIAEYLYIDFIPMSSELLVYCFAMLGGLSGFLWFNSHPAEIFMGDTGSLSFGGIIGAISLMIKQELLLAIIGGVFVAEVLSVVIQVGSYKMRRKRVFLMAPLHHHFELKGWKESKIITRFWIIGAILSIIALGSLKIR